MDIYLSKKNLKNSFQDLLSSQNAVISATYKFQLKTTKDGRRWKIGPLESIGEENGEIESNPLGSELEHPFKMPYNIMDWNYYTEDGWMRSNGIDKIIVECIGEEDRQMEGKNLC